MIQRLLCLCLLLASGYQFCLGQVFVEKQTRHRFAQLNMGLDYQTNFGGTTSYLDALGQSQSLDFKSLNKLRFLIGGTHFWGHADFYIAISLFNPRMRENNQEVYYSSGVETVFKYYPWRIKHKTIRPFVGLSIAPFYYEQDNLNLEYGDGPELNHTSLPVVGGFTFNYKNHLLETSLLWNYANQQDYFISRTVSSTVETPPLYFSVSYRFMLETTLSAEKSWENGTAQSIAADKASKGELNNFFVAAGLSSSFWNGKSSYNEKIRPYITKYSTSIMPDFALGYYLHKPDLNFTLSYRGYGTSTNSYGAIQVLKRRSLAFEITKFLFDYHGFVPFVGPLVSYEDLLFQEEFEDQLIHNIEDNQFTYGLAFGWDIRPNRLQTWILRTNLRWYPKLEIQVEEGNAIAFDNIEFNFIQLVIYPGRMFGK